MLGQSLLEVKNLMHTKKEIPLINENSSMRDALLEITSKRFGCVGVINSKNNLVGIITDGDLRRNIKENFLEFSAKNIMTKNPITILANQSMSDAILVMNKNKITVLFVTNKKNKSPEGIIHIHDCLKIGNQ